MTKRYHTTPSFSSLKRRRVEVNFEGGEITSDGGVLLLREVDRRLRLSESVSKAIPDHRNPFFCVHSQTALVRQRLFGLALGYEDLNDHIQLRHDGAVQTAVGELRTLASPATLCRLEKRASKQAAFDLHWVLVQQFIASFDQPPKQLILDLDATHDLVHGEQVGRHFNSYYDGYCFLPLYVFCGQHLLVSYLRPASRGAAYHATAILKWLVQALRDAWPKVKLIVRADAGFCVPLLLAWCDRERIDYLIGMAQNSVLSRKASLHTTLAASGYRRDDQPQKEFGEFRYRASSWPRERRMIVKAEYSVRGENTRYVVTSLNSSPRHIYATLYCARGNMENCIKEQKCLFSDRTSCHHWWPNQLRVLLSGFAYLLMHEFRRVALVDTELEHCQVDTLRLRLFKVGGIVLRNTRRIRILLSSHFPYQAIFSLAASRLNST